MKIKHCTVLLILLPVILLLSACSDPESESLSNSKWEEYQHIYKTSVQYTGENESTAKYLEIAERSANLFPLLEENVNAFVMDAYNYQVMDDEGTLLYTMNGMDYPQEIDPNGQCIRVSKNYFLYNPIKTEDGSELSELIVYDDLTLNILVPVQYRDMEEQILEAYRERFYFEKVKAANDYNNMAGIDDVLDISQEDLTVNIIYVQDGQKYFTFRSDCAVLTDNWIEDPVVMIYTANIHCNYAHSFMSQWLYFYSDKDNAEDAYQDIVPYIKQCGAENSIQKVFSVFQPTIKEVSPADSELVE